MGPRSELMYSNLGKRQANSRRCRSISKCRRSRCHENLPKRHTREKRAGTYPFEGQLAKEKTKITLQDVELLQSFQMEADTHSGQQPGALQFTNFVVYPVRAWQHFPVEDIRPFYLTPSANGLPRTLVVSDPSMWRRQVLLFLKIGSTNGFVMHSLLALVASRVSWRTGCPLTNIRALEHKGLALEGLQKGIIIFSKQNSDAVLAASLLLLWQATEWCDWIQFMEGMASIVGAMQSWKNESQFVDLFA